MHSDIKKLIDAGEFKNALALVNQKLNRPFDLLNPDDEKEWTRLTGLRVAMNALLRNDDELVLNALRMKKFPVERTFIINDRHQITLQFVNLFLFKADAYVNTIHKETLFNFGPRSASREFIRRLSAEQISEQIKPHIKGSEKKYFYQLRHPELSAPVSYHIPCHEGDNQIDYQALVDGLRSVLNDVTAKGFKQVGLVPLGYDTVVNADKSLKDGVAFEITGRVAETIMRFLFESKKRSIPHLYFCLANTKSYQTHERVFNQWTSVDKDYLDYRKESSAKEQLLINDIGTKNAPYIQVLKKIRPELNTKSSILLRGETGVGKSYLAGLIHKHGNRSGKAFVAENCAVVSRENLYITLFGWKEGSFTGAIADGKGLVEKAEGGILFLDEIGYTDIDVQKALMKFIGESTYRRFGDTENRVADVRLLFRTNQNLGEMIKNGLFLPDLYERISQIELEIPPLRERPEDITIIIDKMMDTLNKQKDYHIVIDDNAKESLSKLKWPGNIRQLKYYIEKMHNECVYNQILHVDSQYVMANPPRDSLYTEGNDYFALEKLLTKILTKWDGKQGKLLDDLIEPLLAHIYLDILEMPKDKAAAILGIDGSRGTESTLMKRHARYIEIKDQLKDF